ncbi:sigma-70 family RNA polymerase sigma factor [Winogradskyella sp. DF17]|uniref:Sigma-70 family RNA polymerase sigma factor n=1 Tax=Winogradskyella pelagia TaxID=2819984 RepID=A0ABS3T590_9FLAO|nr:sigma-70 family RNA polymerase sigma factor [Winogradskyella sp. DF17]MBO3117914.1 sigma-70 family RNA polymerase sigma factor [Winogradskyella sp. DF17]
MDKTDILVAQLKVKDVDAFEQLHHMYAKNILGAINVIIQDEAISKEICQDVFVKVWEKSQLYDAAKGRFFTWLLNMARNAAIDYSRSKEFKTQKKNHSLDLFVSIYEQPTDNTTSGEKYDGLRRMLKQLKRKCVELIEMLYFKDYTQKMAAERLSIPLGTVKSRNRNCLKHLRENLKND